MEIICNLDEAILDALEKDEEIKEEIADAGMFSERILEFIVEIESVLSLHESKSQSGNGSQTPKFKNGKHWQHVQTSETTPNKFEEFLWGAKRVVHILG